jgi:hypothetical protein
MGGLMSLGVWLYQRTVAMKDYWERAGVAMMVTLSKALHGIVLRFVRIA